MTANIHPDANEFRHIMQDEAANWRIIGFTPDAWRLDDYPRYTTRSHVNGSPKSDYAVTYYEFRTKKEAEDFMLDIAVSHALRVRGALIKKRIAAMKKEKFGV